MNTRTDTHWRTESARKRVDALVRALMVALWATPLVLLLLLSCAAPATAASGRGTVYQVTSNGGSPATYTLTVNSTSDITVGDHLLAYTSTSSGVWLVTAKTSTTVTVQDSLTEGNGNVAHGAPSATGPRNVFAFATPAANGLTLIPDASVSYASAALRRNAAETAAGTVAHAFVGADHTGAGTASAARTTLGLAIGSDVQAYDAALANLAAITSAASGQFFVSTGYKGMTNRTLVAADLPAGLATLGAITTATHGHLFVATAQGTIVNLAPGSNDQVLTRDSTQALGLRWSTPAAAGVANPMTAALDAGGYGITNLGSLELGTNKSITTAGGDLTLEALSAGDINLDAPTTGSRNVNVGTNTGNVTIGRSGGTTTCNSDLAIASGKTITGAAIDTTAGDAATINRLAGRFRKDTSGATFTLTNSLISSSSIVILTFASDDATATRATVSAGSGSATITFNAAPTANCDLNFMVVN